MSILIKGIDIPKNCAECPCRTNTEWGDDYCQAIKGEPDIEDSYSGRLDNCPLVAVPTPHGRLIDADAFYNKIKAELEFGGPLTQRKSYLELLNDICEAPTIIEAEE